MHTTLPTGPQPSSPPDPHATTAAKLPLVDRPLRDPPLTLDPFHHAVQLRLDDHAAHNHLAQGRVQRLEVEDEIELAHVLE